MRALTRVLRDLLVAAGVAGSALSAFAQTATALPVGGATASAPPASGPGAENSAARLEQLRNAMIDQALDAPVHISSNAWLDESGRLRHVSRFFSEVRARAAADLIVSAESAAQARATAAVAGGENDGTRATVTAQSGVARQSSAVGLPSSPGPVRDAGVQPLSFNLPRPPSRRLPPPTRSSVERIGAAFADLQSCGLNWFRLMAHAGIPCSTTSRI